MYQNTIDLDSLDAELNKALVGESNRQEEHIELIASENYASPAIMALQGSCLTNKYAEGYPGRRYYGGCQYVDQIEQLAIERAKRLFKADYANVQPHSGSQANAAVFLALLNPGDTILGMGLNDGGHLTHGSWVNYSGKLYKSFAYGLDPKTQDIDYDGLFQQAQEHRPRLIISGFSAYSGTIQWERFREAADAVGAYLMADIAHVAGLIAADLYPSPIGIADVVTSTTHKTLRGPRGGVILAKANPDIEKRLNSAVFPGLQGGPLMHVIAAKALAFREALMPEFRAYQAQVIENARKMLEVMRSRGYQIVLDKTDNHLFLVNLSDRGFSGRTAEEQLGLANITLNKNSVFNDQRSPFETSGLRIGTPAITTRGFKAAESAQVAEWICDILDNIQDQAIIHRVKQAVLSLCAHFPVYR